MPLLPSRRASPPVGWHSFTVSRRAEGSVNLGDWLHTEIKCRPRESNSDTVTHPSTNRAQRRVTSLIETNALPLRQTATQCHYNRRIRHHHHPDDHRHPYLHHRRHQRRHGCRHCFTYILRSQPFTKVHEFVSRREVR